MSNKLSRALYTALRHAEHGPDLKTPDFYRECDAVITGKLKDCGCWRREAVEALDEYEKQLLEERQKYLTIPTLPGSGEADEVAARHIRENSDCSKKRSIKSTVRKILDTLTREQKFHADQLYRFEEKEEDCLSDFSYECYAEEYARQCCEKLIEEIRELIK